MFTSWISSPLPTTDFGEFIKVIEKQKERAAKFDDESDMSGYPVEALQRCAPWFACFIA